jgi:hypothetical protein
MTPVKATEESTDFRNSTWDSDEEDFIFLDDASANMSISRKNNPLHLKSLPQGSLTVGSIREVSLKNATYRCGCNGLLVVFPFLSL